LSIARTDSIVALHLMAAKASTPAPEMTFEAAVERLEEIVQAMESDKLPLADLLVRYEEGTKLVKLCQDQLSAAEKRIEIITRNAKGQVQVESFDPEKTSSAASAMPPAPAPARSKSQPDEVSLF
jgi:exodeoxyribonuclease VII small subunit